MGTEQTERPTPPPAGGGIKENIAYLIDLADYIRKEAVAMTSTDGSGYVTARGMVGETHVAEDGEIGLRDLPKADAPPRKEQE